MLTSNLALQSSDFKELKTKTGSFDDAVRCLFDVKWHADRPVREAVRKGKMKQLKDEAQRFKDERKRNIGKLSARGRSKSG